MSAVERVEYMDNMRSAQMSEVMQRERRIQRDYFRELEAKGKVMPVPPTPEKKHLSPTEEVGVPEHVRTVKMDPELNMGTSISKHMWAGAAPGYIVRDGPRETTVSKKEYAYDAEEVEYMRQQGFMNKTHNRRRDEFVKYVEAHAKMQHLIKGPSPGAQ